MSLTRVLIASLTSLMVLEGRLEMQSRRHGELGGKVLTLAAPVSG